MHHHDMSVTRYVVCISSYHKLDQQMCTNSDFCFLALCPINAPNMIPNEYGGLISPFSRPKGVLTACNGCNLLVIRLYSQTALKLPAFLGRGGWPPSFISHTYNIWDVSHCLLGLGSLPRSFYTPIWCVHLGVGPLGCMSGTKP